MKKRIVIILLCLAAVSGTFFALRAILGRNSASELTVPEGVRIEGHSLVWYPVENADSYEVEVGGESRVTLRAKEVLKYGDNGKTVRVRALAEGRSPSGYTEAFAVNFSKDALSANTVTYGLKQLGVSRTEFIESGAPISVAPEDYTAYGYEFLFWYVAGSGGKTPQETPFISWESVTLLAEVRPIDYPVTFIVPEDFTFENGLPSVYNVENISGLATLSAEKDGYTVDGWFIGSQGGSLLTAGAVVTGPLTLYPRISLKNGGFVFEKRSGGYALKSYAGEDSELYVPARYNGEPVVEVLAGAIGGENAPNVESVTFYGNISLAENSVSGCLRLKSITFLGDLTAAENSVFVAGDAAEPDAPLSVYIYGTPSEAAFISGYFGLSPEKRVEIFVRAEYLAGISAAFSSEENVFVYALE